MGISPIMLRLCLPIDVSWLATPSQSSVRACGSSSRSLHSLPGRSWRLCESSSRRSSTSQNVLARSVCEQGASRGALQAHSMSSALTCLIISSACCCSRSAAALMASVAASTSMSASMASNAPIPLADGCASQTAALPARLWVVGVIAMVEPGVWTCPCFEPGVQTGGDRGMEGSTAIGGADTSRSPRRAARC